MGSASASAWLKADLLANGVTPTPGFLRSYGPPFLEKRRAYGNPDDLVFLGRSLPQEMLILPEGLVCSVNLRSQSPWVLDGSVSSGFVVRKGEESVPISFPKTPAFYSEILPDGREVCSVVTLYGGGSLGVFVRGECALVDMGKPCQYCSISPNRGRQTDFPTVVTGELLRGALTLALEDEECPVTQVMINGGNFADPNRSFLYYAKLCSVAREVIVSSGRDVELHLIVYPPADLDLMKELGGLGLSVAMNLEVFTPELFARYCPGKDATLGQRHLESALRRAVDVLGAGNVFSILVGGLEDQSVMDAGMERLAAAGIIPVINVFHPDPETPLAGHPAPPQARILQMGESLQRVFERSSFTRPFYLHCGRNSLDTEAHLRMFEAA